MADEERLRSAVRDVVIARVGDGRKLEWVHTLDHSPPTDYKFPFCYFITNSREQLAKAANMTNFNEDGAKNIITKTAKSNITAKLSLVGMKPVDVPADGNCFLHAARFALLQLKKWNINVAATVLSIRSEVVRFLTINAQLHVIWDGRTLREVRGDMEDPPSLTMRTRNRLEKYDSWTKHINYMKQPDKYADVLFLIGVSQVYNVSVSIISDLNNVPQVYFLGITPPTDVITLCFLHSKEHYYASRGLAPMAREEHAVPIEISYSQEAAQQLALTTKDSSPVTDPDTIEQIAETSTLDPHICTGHT